MSKNSELIKAERLVLDEVEEIMALVRDFDLKGWLAAEAKIDGDASAGDAEVKAKEAEQTLRDKLRELCTLATPQRNQAPTKPVAWIHNDTLATMNASTNQAGERWPVVKLSEWADKSTHTALCVVPISS
jgi:hypothetical protein